MFIEDANLTLPDYDPEAHWPEWTDMLGRTFRPGDLVAVGITAGRSASITVGMVLRINRKDSKGETLTIRDTSQPSIETVHTPSYQGGKPWSTWDWPRIEHCTVTFQPLVDSSNRFSRGNTPRPSTVGPEKIVLLDHLTLADVL